MSILASAPPQVAHPEWCSRPFCDVGRYDHATRHCSTPVTWRVERDDVELTLTVEQTHERGQDPREPGLVLTTFDTLSVWPDGAPIYSRVFLGPADLDVLNARAAEMLAGVTA